MSSIRWCGGRLNPDDLKIITHAATAQRSTPLDFMVRMTRMVIDTGNVPLKPESKATISNRRTTIKKLIGKYLTLSRERDELYGTAYLLRQQIADLTDGATDMFSLSNSNVEYSELLYDLAQVENQLANPNIGVGILQDISNLLSSDYTLPLSDIGNDTEFLLSAPQGTLSIPYKVRDDVVWLGSLPKNSLLIINGKKAVVC